MLLKLEHASSERDRYYALGDAARVSFKRGQHVKAYLMAMELLNLAKRFPDGWNYGNAIHDAHIVLGWIALKEGDVDLAKRHLLDAGRTPGSPQLDSFGPNMSLARGLIERGERDAVLAYFKLCRVFWDGEEERLEAWATEVKAGNMPDFGDALVN